jgi:hypothetical protein
MGCLESILNITFFQFEKFLMQAAKGFVSINLPYLPLRYAIGRSI